MLIIVHLFSSGFKAYANQNFNLKYLSENPTRTFVGFSPNSIGTIDPPRVQYLQPYSNSATPSNKLLYSNSSKLIVLFAFVLFVYSLFSYSIYCWVFQSLCCFNLCLGKIISSLIILSSILVGFSVFFINKVIISKSLHCFISNRSLTLFY